MRAPEGWDVAGINFHTGIPSTADKPFWNQFWTAKMAVVGTRAIRTFCRPRRYRNQTISLPDGTLAVTLVGQEKGVDVRIALDIVRLALDDKYDVALIFSQDQDLSEAVEDVKKISILQNRWVKSACAFLTSPTVQPAGTLGVAPASGSATHMASDAFGRLSDPPVRSGQQARAYNVFR
jgi:hypothetical protein